MNKGESYEETFLKLLAVSMLVGCITACVMIQKKILEHIKKN